MTRALAAAAVIAALVAGCSEPSGSASARRDYNAALGLIEDKAWDAAQTALFDARAGAGADSELRYRAAFALGRMSALRAEEAVAEDPQTAIQLNYAAAGWFQDAIGLRPDAEEARQNLQVVLKRAQSLADAASKSGNPLRDKLERAIEDQRSLRDRTRALIRASDQGDSVGDQLATQYRELATFERTLVAEVGTVSDIGADELAAIEDTPEEQRDEAQKTRAVQLSNLEFYLSRARQSLSDTRRFLRRQDGQRGLRRAETALTELKRAREQLLDPVAVLKGLAQDQATVLRQTEVLDQISSGSIKLSAKPDDSRKPTQLSWLTAADLAERERELSQRHTELFQRLSAGIDAQAAAADPQSGAQNADPQQAAMAEQQKQMIEAVRRALPHVETAGSKIADAVTALDGGALEAANTAETEALTALARAIEEFAGVRDIIELTYRDQLGFLALLDPNSAATAGAALSTAQRAEQLAELSARNRARLERLEGLLRAERAAESAKAGQAGQAGQQGGDPQAAAAIAEKFDMAERLRAEALAAVVEQQAALAARGADPAAPATVGKDKLQQLRRLFYTLIEHLKQLHRDQGETRDRTATAQSQDAADRDAQIAPLGDSQSAHTAMSDQIAMALAEQADAAAGGQGQQAQEQSQRFRDAAASVRAATDSMLSAGSSLSEARESVGQMTYDLEPILTDQQSAIDHLQTAIEILEPPQDQNQDNQDQKQQDQQQQMSQQQAQRRMQKIREREANRQKDRNRNQARDPEVEKDW